LKKANFLEFPVDPLSNGKEKVSNLIRENLAEIDRLIEINDKNYLNFVAPLSDLHRKMHELTVPISHIHHVQNSEKSKDVYSSILPELSNYDSEISQNLQIYSSLKEIAQETGGRYIRSVSGDLDINQIYKEIKMKAGGNELKSSRRQQFVERYQWPLLFALLSLLLEGWVSERSRSRAKMKS